LRIHVGQGIRPRTGGFARLCRRQAQVGQVGYDDAVIGVRQTHRAADEGTAQAEGPGSRTALQVDAQPVDTGAEALETIDIDLHLPQQRAGRLLRVALAMLIKHGTPGIPVQLRQAPLDVQPGSPR